MIKRKKPLAVGDVVFDFGNTLVGTITKIEGDRTYLSMIQPNDLRFHCERYNRMFFDSEIKENELEWVSLDPFDIYEIDWTRESKEGGHMLCIEHDPYFSDLGFEYYCPVLEVDLFPEQTKYNGEPKRFPIAK